MVRLRSCDSKIDVHLTRYGCGEGELALFLLGLLGLGDRSNRFVNVVRGGCFRAYGVSMFEREMRRNGGPETDD